MWLGPRMKQLKWTGGEYCGNPFLSVPSALLFIECVFYCPVYCCSCPSDSPSVLLSRYSPSSLFLHLPCLECSCLLHQGRAFLPVIVDPPMSSCSLPLEKTLRPNEAKPLPALRPQCCSFPLVLCLKYSLLHFIIRGLLETQL